VASGAGWDEARKAWRRLSERGRRDDGAAALDRLADIGTVRRCLDTSELEAVRTARRTGRSWAEIATSLGVTRQSAWEKWRDLDDQQTPGDAGLGEPDVVRAVAEAMLGEASLSSTVTVPDVIGITPDDAAEVLRRAGLSPVEHVPGGAQTELRPERAGVVVDQTPRAGVRRRRGSTVALWIQEGGGSAGVREPRRPKPAPRAGADVRDIA
jgi:hypothetical protein